MPNILEAFDHTVLDLKTNYPNVVYDGCIQYAWVDEHCGDVVSFELVGRETAKDRVYDFVGRILEESIDSGCFVEEIEDYCDGGEEAAEELAKMVRDYGPYLSEDSKEKMSSLIATVRG